MSKRNQENDGNGQPHKRQSIEKPAQHVKFESAVGRVYCIQNIMYTMGKQVLPDFLTATEQIRYAHWISHGDPKMNYLGQSTTLDFRQDNRAKADDAIQILRQMTDGHLDKVRTIILKYSMFVTDEFLDILLRKCPNLQHLDLTECSDITQNGLLSIVHHCPKLTHLILRKCTGIVVNDIFSHRPLPNLTHLDLSFCNHLSTSVISTLIGDNNITFLDLTACNQVATLFKQVSNLKTLTHFRFHLNNHNTEISVEFIRALLENNTSLTSLSLNEYGHQNENSHYNNLEVFAPEDSVPGACTTFKNLTSLSLVGCVGLLDDELRKIGRLTKLKELHLGKCRALTENTLKVICESCPSLEFIDLRKCDRIQSEMLRYLDGIGVDFKSPEA
jgi:hypothetical protein